MGGKRRKVNGMATSLHESRGEMLRNTRHDPHPRRKEGEEED